MLPRALGFGSVMSVLTSCLPQAYAPRLVGGLLMPPGMLLRLRLPVSAPSRLALGLAAAPPSPALGLSGGVPPSSPFGGPRSPAVRRCGPVMIPSVGGAPAGGAWGTPDGADCMAPRERMGEAPLRRAAAAAAAEMPLSEARVPLPLLTRLAESAPRLAAATPLPAALLAEEGLEVGRTMLPCRELALRCSGRGGAYAHSVPGTRLEKSAAAHGNSKVRAIPSLAECHHCCYPAR